MLAGGAPASGLGAPLGRSLVGIGISEFGSTVARHRRRKLRFPQLFEHNFCGKNKVHQVTKVQRDLPYKALIKGRNDISK